MLALAISFNTALKNTVKYMLEKPNTYIKMPGWSLKLHVTSQVLLWGVFT